MEFTTGRGARGRNVNHTNVVHLGRRYGHRAHDPDDYKGGSGVRCMWLIYRGSFEKSLMLRAMQVLPFVTTFNRLEVATKVRSNTKGCSKLCNASTSWSAFGARWSGILMYFVTPCTVGVSIWLAGWYDGKYVLVGKKVLRASWMQARQAALDATAAVASFISCCLYREYSNRAAEGTPR